MPNFPLSAKEMADRLRFIATNYLAGKPIARDLRMAADMLEFIDAHHIIGKPSLEN